MCRITRKPQPLALTPHRAAAANENAATIRAIPIAQLPAGPAREALIALALAGYDVYAYTPVASGCWTIWLRPEYPWQEGRMSCAEWLARFDASNLQRGLWGESREGC